MQARLEGLLELSFCLRPLNFEVEGHLEASTRVALRDCSLWLMPAGWCTLPRTTAPCLLRFNGAETLLFVVLAGHIKANF